MRFSFFILLFSLSLLAQKPNLLLLKTYKDQNISGWVMSEKLDGVRAYWDGKQLLTRGGKIIHAPAWFTKDYPPFAIDGELWTKREDFENIISIVRDKVPSEDWKQIKHTIFEVPEAKGDLFERLSKVKPYENKVIHILPQIYVKNTKHLETFHNALDKKGAEGVVVRDPKMPYIDKRTSRALKVKYFKDAECEVIGHTQGKGKYQGMLGALKCRLDNGIIFKIGTGLSDDERKKPPKVGSRVTFKYQNMTKYGKPRFPVYLRVRKDMH
ncbi:MAG: DNA ligase [Sulfurovum sp.]|nr:DNA ligase [Sulfurovum sp.]